MIFHCSECTTAWHTVKQNCSIVPEEGTDQQYHISADTDFF